MEPTLQARGRSVPIAILPVKTREDVPEELCTCHHGKEIKKVKCEDCHVS